MDNTSKVANSWYSFGPRNIHDAAKKFMEIYKAPAQFDPELASIVSSSTTPQISSLTTQEAYMQVSEGSSTFDVGNSLNPAISLHVLVVDDNEINLKIMSSFMRKIGCHYETASNGQIALEKYTSANQPYNFVLMDISMPVMDGLVATKRIREHERQNCLYSSCILAVTAVASIETQEAALKAGVDDYLVKPLSLNRLREKLGLV
jgi:CheY-like chemotaxis protein